MFPENDQGGGQAVEAEVKWYNGRKGFGFVLGPDGQDVFFHASALTEAGIEPPETGDKLVCEIGSDRQGRRLITRIIERKLGPGGATVPGGDRPRFGDRPGGDRPGGDRPGGDRPGGDRPGGFGDRPPRRDFGDRPPRSGFGGPPSGGFGGPPSGGFGDRPPRRDFGAPPGGGFGDRPPRRDFGGPPSGGFGDRPPRRDFGGPPSGGFGGDRGPPRREGGRDEGGPTYAVNGTVKWFDQVRGFGFVTPDDGGQDVFLHSSVLQRAGKQEVQQGEKVALDVRDGQRGRQAVSMKD